MPGRGCAQAHVTAAVDIAALQDTKCTAAAKELLTFWLRQAEPAAEAQRHEVLWCHGGGIRGLPVAFRQGSSGSERIYASGRLECAGTRGTQV